MMRLLGLAAVLLALRAHAEALPPQACGAPQYPAEARRYQLAGTTTLGLTLRADGTVERATVAASSGWGLLDRAALKLTGTCHFAARTDAAPATLAVVWRLPASAVPAAAPALRADSCRHTPLLQPISSGGAEQPVLTVRLLVWSDGQVYEPRLEAGSGDPTVDQAAILLAQGCRYAPAVEDGVPVKGAAVLRLAYHAELLDDAALRAVYQRLLGRMEQDAAGKREFRVAHILLPSEQAARDALAEIRAGAAFADVAARKSLDRHGANGGDLGWERAAVFVPEFAAALTRATTEGLLPDVVKTAFGWHVIRIDGIRPAQVPSFDMAHAELRKRVLLEALRDLQ